MSRWRRFLTWLTRPQFTAITIGAAYLLGNLAAFHLPWWAQVTAAAAIGVMWGLLTALVPRLLRSPHPDGG